MGGLRWNAPDSSRVRRIIKTVNIETVLMVAFCLSIISILGVLLIRLLNGVLAIWQLISWCLVV